MILKKDMVCTIKKTFTSRPMKALLMVMIITVVSLSFTSCSKEKAEPERLVNVRVWPAETRRVQPYLEATGTLKPDEDVLVTTEVDGIVKKFMWMRGQTSAWGLFWPKSTTRITC